MTQAEGSENPPTSTVAEAPSPALAERVPWEMVIALSWRKLAATFAAGLSVASLIWQATHADLIQQFVFRPDLVARDGRHERRILALLAASAAVVAAGMCIPVLRRVRRGVDAGAIHRELLVMSLLPLPLLTVSGFEFDHPVYTGAIMIGFSLALARLVSRETTALSAWNDLTRRQAMALVAMCAVLFTATIGFLAYWRYITFHAQLCDSTWETNSIWGIVHHGIPTISVSAYMYDGKQLPAPYFNDHVPFGDYLYAPFFAIYQDARTLVLMQPAFMSTGAIGAYLIGRHWLGTRIAGVLASFLYVLNPSVQSFCLHDIHPNILAIPSVMLAVGLMAAKRPWAALGFGALAAICHEETPMYAAGLGLFWMLSGEPERRRFRIGFGLCLFSLAAALLFSMALMPHFGGHPRWEHFNLFFDSKPSAGSMIRALVLNPLGAAVNVATDMKLDYLTISLIPLGGLALLGWRAGWFLLPALLLLVPSNSPGFFCPGMNYSAPLVPAVLLMSLAGLRRFWAQGGGRSLRVSAAAYVLSTALIGNYLYGNIAAKTFKIEYGFSPLRRQNQHHYRDMMGYVDALPPFGAIERGLWDVIRRVPPGAAVLSSWAINPQLANRDVSLAINYSGGNPAPDERVDYVVIDKLPAMQVPIEPEIEKFRHDARYRVFYENDSGIIFARQRE